MKKLIFILPLILLSLTLNAQNSDKFTGSLLWEISGNGLEKPSYIFGTHHLVDVDFAKTYPGFNDALESVSQVIGEILMSDMPAIQQAMMSNAMMTGEESYNSLLSEDDYNVLDQSLKSNFGTGLDQLGKIKPALLGVMYANLTYAKLMPEYNPMTHISIDQYVQQQAVNNNKKIGGLETVEDQIYVLLDSQPLKEQAEALICSVKNPENGEKELALLNQYYSEGKLYEAYATVFESKESPCQMSEEFAQNLNKNRNDKWMEKIPGIMADEPTFIAVGMLHLCGQEGILYQLDQLGYTIKAVK